MTRLVFVRLLVTCGIAACGMEWNVRKVTAERWVICGMRKVAVGGRMGFHMGCRGGGGVGV